MIRRAEGAVAECVALFRENHTEALIHRAWQLPAPDLADVLSSLARSERAGLLTLLPPTLAARGLAEMPAEAGPGELLATLPPPVAALIVSVLDDVHAADLLGSVLPRSREAILAVVESRGPIDRLLQFELNSAGRMMTSAMITITDVDPMGFAIESVRNQARLVPEVDDIYVVDIARRLVGLLNFRQLVLASRDVAVRERMTPVLSRVGTAEKRENVIRRIRRYRLSSLPVVDEYDRLIGRITSDEGADVATREATDAFLGFAGVAPPEAQSTSWPVAVRSRLPTLYANLLTAFLAAAVIHTVTQRPGRLTPLLVWLPVVVGMGGNAGIQALASTLHRLSQGRLPWNRRRVVLAREIVVGLVNGAVIGGIVAGVALLLGESWRAGLVVMLAMIIYLPLAGGLAAVLPMVLRRARFNPSLASAPTVITLLDAAGMAVLFGLGMLIL